MSQELQVTDQQLQALVLQRFYDDRRCERTRPSASWLNGEVDETEIYRICNQLAEVGLIKFKPWVNGAWGRITAYGVNAIESKSSPDAAINYVSNITANVTSPSHVIIGDNNN